jgi:hypothetical protein
MSLFSELKKIDPVGGAILGFESKLPGTPGAAVAALSGGLDNSLSWNPYSSRNSVWDMGAGGSILSQNPRNRTVGRAVGSAIGGYFGAGALGLGAGAGADTGVAADAAATSGGLSSADTAALYGDAGYGAGLTGAETTAIDNVGTGLLADAGTGTLTDAGGSSFLPVTGGGDAMSPLSPELASQLGISTFDTTGVAPAAVDSTSLAGVDQLGAAPALDATSPALGDTGGGFFDSAGRWISGHKSGTALLGLSMLNALNKPKMPGSVNTLQNSGNAEVAQAQAILASGGTSSPQWQTMKASIDQSIDANVRNAIEAAKQNAANSGMGVDSAVARQHIDRIMADAATQKAQAYSQALGAIVSQAITELSGGNAVLGQVAQLQMQREEQARAAAAQTAELALLLFGKG